MVVKKDIRYLSMCGSAHSLYIDLPLVYVVNICFSYDVVWRLVPAAAAAAAAALNVRATLYC